MALAVAAAGAATLLLRPRGIAPDAAAVDPTAYFTAEQLDRARDFRGPQRLIGLGALAASGATLALLALRPPAPLRALCARVERRPLLGGAAIGATIVIVLELVGLPFGLVAHERAVDAGLSVQDLSGWLSDRGLATALAAGFAATGGLVALALVRRFPRHWWAPAGAIVIAVAVAVTFAGPVLLDPIFNRFEPLPAGELRSSVLELAERAGVDVGEVYSVDASRRTTATNAYVGGLGETKRVVLYDNLIDGLPAEQARSVIAHELAHVRYDDLRNGLLWVSIVALPAMLVVQRLTEAIVARRRSPGGRAVPGLPASIPALALALGLVVFGVQVAGNWLSREVERRADAYALELTGDPAAFVGLQRALATENLKEPEPPAVTQVLFGTHPTTVERIGLGLEWAARR